MYNSKDLNMLRAAYVLAKGNTFGYQNLLARARRERPELLENAFLQLKSPLDSTLLHIAASHGNEVVDHVVQENPQYLDAINMEHDTPSHVAARAGHVSTDQALTN
ncbi:hypothetical protein L6164_004724 [Bauhinia variegata]|uniref:Uncharacterized protein n=1 Tax=Bauhinia variegata TaxID=167791 RepID=A0ACB9PR26_BAUVA|nr:hypothetical protein L6164_004724 [Bauhinia variegata]